MIIGQPDTDMPGRFATRAAAAISARTLRWPRACCLRRFLRTPHLRQRMRLRAYIYPARLDLLAKTSMPPVNI